MITIGVVCVGILIQRKMLLLKRVHFAVKIAIAKHACGWTLLLKSVSPFLTSHELVVFSFDVVVVVGLFFIFYFLNLFLMHVKSDIIYSLLQNLNLELIVSVDEQFEHHKYVLQTLLPFLKRLNEEHMIEKKMEAKRQGIFFQSLPNKFRNLYMVQLILSF
jgi:hypothetical protein